MAWLRRFRARERVAGGQGRSLERSGGCGQRGCCALRKAAVSRCSRFQARTWEHNSCQALPRSSPLPPKASVCRYALSPGRHVRSDRFMRSWRLQIRWHLRASACVDPLKRVTTNPMDRLTTSGATAFRGSMEPAQKLINGATGNGHAVCWGAPQRCESGDEGDESWHYTSTCGEAGEGERCTRLRGRRARSAAVRSGTLACGTAVA